MDIAVADVHIESHATAGSGGVARECLSIRLGDEEYGIDILRVQEIRGYEKPTRIVGAPDDVRGVLNLRGAIVPIVDLRLRFGRDAQFTTSTVTVLLSLSGRTVGAVVDSVSDVLQIAAEQIEAPPEIEGAVGARFINGIATLGKGEHPRMLILVDIERMMADGDIA